MTTLSTQPLVHIILCAFEPNLDFLAKQVRSISAQTYARWTCSVRLDKGQSDCAQAVSALIAADTRFSLTEATRRLGVYHNFEEGLAATPASAEIIAYCDQDDEWVPHKLAVIIEALEDQSVALVHSDLEAIDAEGNQLFPSCFVAEKRVVEDFSLAQLIVRNSVTGCACAFRSSLLPNLLPFPEQGIDIAFHHDLWTAMVASQVGRVVAISEPLVKYRQHGGNVVGLEARARTISRAPLKLRAKSWRNNWVLRERLITEALARRISGSRSYQQREELRKWQSANFISVKLLVRSIRLARQGYPAGLVGIETALGKAVVTLMPTFRKLRIAVQRFRGTVKFGRVLLRASRSLAFDPAFRNKAYHKIGQLSRSFDETSNAQALNVTPYSEQYLSPLNFDLTAFSPRVVILVPTGRVSYIFGGLTTIFKFGAGLARQGVPVRFLSIDHNLGPADVDALRAFLRERCGFAGEWHSIEIVSSEDKNLQGHPRDVFVATIWWSARRLFETMEKYPFAMKEFYYFIQDYEPGFYAWSNEFALANSTYFMPCRPIVNTKFLADHLEREVGLITPANRVFNPEIEWHLFHPPALGEMEQRQRKRVFFYGRPSTARNLFDVGLAALRKFVRALNLQPDQIEIVSAGEDHAQVSISSQIFMKSLGKLEMEEYAQQLRQSDIGFALMLSPHPSYPPFEMAASGLVVVTNNFSTKSMSFSNMVSCEATPESLADGLAQAWERSTDHVARAAGAKLNASRLGRRLSELVPEVALEMRDLLGSEGAESSYSSQGELSYRVGFGATLDFADARVCLFSHFDIGNVVDPYVLNYLKALRDEGFRIVLITSHSELEAGSLEALQTVVSALIYRENKGYDFAGWALGLALFPSIYQARELLLCNDSVYGPVQALAPLFERMNGTEADFWGITDSYEVEWHIQSYFLVFKQTALRSTAFQAFWKSVKAIPNKTELIYKYEVPLARHLSQGGLRPSVVINAREVCKTISNPTLHPWRDTLVKGGSPFIKVQLLRDNPLNSDISGWEDVVQSFGYDTSLIQHHLSRVKPNWSEAKNPHFTLDSASL